jgi:hypothetical protein
MKIGIMQPYFFPYIGYYSLIKHTDQWIVFDTPQFIRHGWIDRNRILKPSDGWQYIKVPIVKHPRDTAIKDTLIKQDIDWQSRILAQLEHYKKSAPFYADVIHIVREVFNMRTNSIVSLNIRSLSLICSYLNIDFTYSVFSESDLRINPVCEPDEWALEISKALKAKEYYNLIGGLSFFNRKKYQDNGIELKFLKQAIVEYDQRRNGFEPGLSIIDVMMFNSKEVIDNMLDDYTLL